jgi:hypothetical protein
MLRGGNNPTRPWRDFDATDGEATFWFKPPAGQRKGGVSMSAGATESVGTDAALLDMEFPDPRFFSAGLADADPDIFAAIQKEAERQQDKLEMIASENIVSRAVLEAQGSILTNKYAEGCASCPLQLPTTLGSSFLRERPELTDSNSRHGSMRFGHDCETEETRVVSVRVFEGEPLSPSTHLARAQR